MRRTTIGTLLVAATLVLAACGDDDAGSDVTVPPDDTSSNSSSSTSEKTPTSEDPTAAVEQAFYDQWDAFVEITSDPDIENPLIDEFFTGEAKEALLDVVSEFLADGQAARLPDDPDDFQPRIVETSIRSSTEALVVECTVDGAVIYNVDTGDVVNSDVGLYEARNTFLLIDGRWKLAESHSVSEGDPTCDEL